MDHYLAFQKNNTKKVTDFSKINNTALLEKRIFENEHLSGK